MSNLVTTFARLALLGICCIFLVSAGEVDSQYGARGKFNNRRMGKLEMPTDGVRLE